MTKEKQNNTNILILSDMHIPYHHPDMFKFLRAVKAKYKPKRVISVGDELDYHAMSFHDTDPDLDGPGKELRQSIKELKKLYDIFPKVDLVDPNHGSMVYRKGKAFGLPRAVLRDYEEVLEAPKGWKWHNTLTVKLPSGQDLFVCHGMKKAGIKLAESLGMCVVQGHFHTEFSIGYSASLFQTVWAMAVGCLINDASLAFAYNKITPLRPVLGVGMVIDSNPLLIPMVLKANGRWNGKA